MSDELFAEFESPPSLNLGDGDDDDAPLESLTPGRPRIRGYSKLAWLVVISLTLFTTTLAIANNWMQTRVEVTAAELADIKGSGQLILALREPGWFSRWIEQFGGGIDDFIDGTLDGLNYGPLERRFGYAILVNEARGPVAALQALEHTRARAAAVGVEYSTGQAELERIIVRVVTAYRDGEPPGLSDAERSELKSRLGWAAELLQCPETMIDESSRARRKIMVVRARQYVNFNIAAIGILSMTVLTGIPVLFAFGWLLSAGRIHSRVVDDSGCGPVYIETFALWFALFVGSSLAIELTPLGNLAPRYLPMILPLVALAWPMRRGVSFSDFRQDIGWQLGNPLVEIAAGIAGYLALLPFIVAGLLATLVLSSLLYLISAPNEFSPVGVPHPIAHEITGDDPFWTIFKLLMLTAVAAPLIEETMFRGVLYRHLRDASRHMTRWISVLFASLLNGLIFAAIHPQGIVAIPALVVLGAGFCLVRQWRGSLIAPMTMHALHNGILTLLLARMMM